MLYTNICGEFCAETSHTHPLWGHQRCILHLVKMAFYHPFNILVGVVNNCIIPMASKHS